VFLYVFDLIELDGDDLRRDPLAVRKATLASLLARAAPGLRFNEHLDEQAARSCSRTRVSSALRASCQKGRIRAIVPGDRRIGSSQRIRTRQL
jgi:ATP-dependent DNA ligase